MKRSPLIFFGTVAALGLAALAIWVWATRPEPTLMLFVGAELAVCASAARRREPANELPTADSFGVFRS